jgi:hypothetical protein
MMVIMIVEQSVELSAREIEAFWENLHQLHFVHHKSHVIGLGFEPGEPFLKASDCVRYGTAFDFCNT